MALDALGTRTPTQQKYSDKATALHKLTHRNNVHLLEKGYTILVERIVADSKAMKEGRTAADATQQQRETGDNGQEMALWGGFFTMVGSHKLPALWLQLGEWPTFSSAFSSNSFSCPHMHSIVNKKTFFSSSLMLLYVKNKIVVFICFRKEKKVRSYMYHIHASLYFLYFL